MTRQFTEAQRLAIDSDAKDICVSAGAGSGKTGVLVERFLRIVTESLSGTLPEPDRANINEILVVTFTDRATKEMKSRIVDALNRLELVEERRQLESAYISTIHGLCSRLLKENSFEAGVDPEFTILDNAVSRRMIRSAFEEVIAESLRTNDIEFCELLASLINDPSLNVSDLDIPSQLAEEAETIMHKFRGAGVTIAELEKIQRADYSGGSAIDPLQALLNPALTELSTCVEELNRMAAEAGGTIHRSLASTLDTVRKMQGGADTVTRLANVQAMNASALNALTLIGTSTPPAGLPTLLDRICIACGPVSELFGITAEREAQSRINSRSFAGLVSKMWARYATNKQQLGALDNDDLLTECVTLLEESPDVRRRCQKQFKHLLIDEFQDTDLLQVRLLEQLHPPGVHISVIQSSHTRDTNVSLNNLFIVGDVQQSIYGFRNADPAIFCSVERQFRDAHGGLHVQLSDNFRSRPEILDLVRQVFTLAWSRETTPFVPLQCAAAFDSKSSPSIEVLITSNLARREYIHCEAEAIARQIKSLVEDAEQQQLVTAAADKRNGSSIGYGDIAVLFRGMTDIGIYEDAFARNSVPALVTAGGRGYYARYEIQDLLSVLTLLDSPLNDAALLTALRSPFVGSDIDTIYRLSILAGRSGNWDDDSRFRSPLYPALQQLLAFPDLPDAERNKIVPFLSAIDELRKGVDRIPVGQLIERLIVRTNYDMRLVCRVGGRRKLANIRKLTQIALSEPTLTVSEFVSRMQYMKTISDREGDAAMTEEGAGVVRLMTIHSAKGLEFPVVVLPDLSRGLVAPETGLFNCDPLSRAIGARICGEPDATYKAIVKRRQDADRSESLRLLYVAITRAREHLILCGNVGRNRGFNWADVVFPALGVTTDSVGQSAPGRQMLRGGIEAAVARMDLE